MGRIDSGIRDGGYKGSWLQMLGPRQRESEQVGGSMGPSHPSDMISDISFER